MAKIRLAKARDLDPTRPRSARHWGGRPPFRRLRGGRAESKRSSSGAPMNDYAPSRILTCCCSSGCTAELFKCGHAGGRRSTRGSADDKVQSNCVRKAGLIVLPFVSWFVIAFGGWKTSSRSCAKS